MATLTDLRVKALELLRTEGPLGFDTIKERLKAADSEVGFALGFLEARELITYQLSEGWAPTGLVHDAIAAICRDIVAAGLGITENEIPPKPWARIIYHFAAAHEGEKEAEIRTGFLRHLEELGVDQDFQLQTEWSFK